MIKRRALAFAIVIGVIAGALLISALYRFTGFSLFGGVGEKPLSTDKVNNQKISELAYAILDNMKDGDYEALSRVAHPELGILFSPQATISTSTNKRFSAAEIASFGTDMNVYVWGVHGEGGEPINMTPSEYFSSFVYCKDFSSAPFIGIDRIVRSGNALENITDVFPNIRFVEFHIPGECIEPSDDSGWRTLRLGFEEYNGSLWLTLISHGECLA
jgi:hypothetical protein